VGALGLRPWDWLSLIGKYKITFTRILRVHLMMVYGLGQMREEYAPLSYVYLTSVHGFALAVQCACC